MTMFEAPPSGVGVRMYRSGHGDCFLLALPRAGGGAPVFVLIDCGFWTGSQHSVNPRGIEAIVDHIGASTGHRLDLVVITHAHKDHVNGIGEANAFHFEPFHFECAWMPWTEDPDDEQAKALRAEHMAQVEAVIAARRELAGRGLNRIAGRIDALLSLELGGPDEPLDPEELLRAATNLTNSAVEEEMTWVKEKAGQNAGVSYLRPGGAPCEIAGTAVRVFVLGPPLSEERLKQQKPQEGEGFPRVKDKEATEDVVALSERDTAQLAAVENLAERASNMINNTSLVLAFELPVSKKVLLFVGDAQRGNWVSWTDHAWTEGDQNITAYDLLARTVVYKVGHHGSHNATLAGTVADPHPNLSWMATDPAAAAEFTAMIPAVPDWAKTKWDWDHPEPSIKAALLRKAQGRVFQTDTDTLERPEAVPHATWEAFRSRSAFEKLYFDYTVLDNDPSTRR